VEVLRYSLLTGFVGPQSQAPAAQLHVKRMNPSQGLLLWVVVGSLVVGCWPHVRESRTNAPPQPRALAEAEASVIARRTLATNSGRDGPETNVFYQAYPDGRGWLVVAETIDGTNASGEPMVTVGRDRIVSIDEHGAVKHIVLGR